ncbi:hypothetical protein ACFR9U_17215 [Halorientalis brevis]|uniref:PGF-CTERM sorting domain-containing protein n=1 Tax=Halorientalis brevis TaxID=1126241 RepID=A0ABD6CGA2_9EURY|nr:hypothetical protein [Halorientalis brevis]
MGGWLASDDDGAIWDGPDPLNLGGSDSGSGSGGGSSGDSTDSGDETPQHVPTGVQNPFNWQVEDGDVTAPPDSAVTEDGEVAGSETVVDDDGSLDINPLGDITLDPTDEDYQSTPDGAQPTQQPETTLSRIFYQTGSADQAVNEAAQQQQNQQTMMFAAIALAAVAAVAIGRGR